MMPKLHETQNVVIHLYTRDHGEPHVHAKSKHDSRKEAKITFKGRVISSALSERDLKDALYWVKNNKNRLDSEWKKLYGEDLV